MFPDDASALSEARFHESVKLGEVLCARSIEPFEGGRWRLRWMLANTRSVRRASGFVQTGKPKVISRRADLRHYFRLADKPLTMRCSPGEES
jgi:hypothetical protein